LCTALAAHSDCEIICLVIAILFAHNTGCTLCFSKNRDYVANAKQFIYSWIKILFKAQIMEQGIYNGHETTLFVDFWLLTSLNSPLTLPGTRALINVKTSATYVNPQLSGPISFQ